MIKIKKLFLGIILTTLVVATGVSPAFASVTDIVPKSSDNPSSLSITDPPPM